MLKKYLKLLFQSKLVILLIILGTLAWSSTMVRSGICWQPGCRNGIGFWGANGHDAIWHISLANSLKRGTFEMPIFAGQNIKNYHIGYDYILAQLSLIAGVKISTLYFQILPPVLAAVLGALVYLFVVKWKSNKTAAIASVFFVYFGTNFSLQESKFWSQQSISTLINPPFALSLVILFIFLNVLLVKKQSLVKKIVLVTLIVTLSQVKIYANLLLVGCLSLHLIYKFITRQKNNLLLVTLVSIIISFALVITGNKESSSLIVWQPFWFLETMMQLTDRVGWVRYGEAMQNYKYANNWMKFVPAYSFAFLLFLVGNMGTRVISFFEYIKIAKKPTKIDDATFIIFSLIIIGTAVPMFFLQKGTPWNTIQFFYYSLIFSSVIAGLSLEKLINNTKTKLLAVIVVLLTLPTNIYTLKNIYLTTNPPAKLSQNEIAALEFLSNQDYGTVLTYPYDQNKSNEALQNPPRNLHLYTSTAYVSAYSNKPVFLEDEINLDITNYDWRNRRLEIEKFYKNNKIEETRRFLANNNIKYIYWHQYERALLGETQLGIEKIYENKEVNIYKVTH